MAEPFLSEIRIFSFNFPPKGWAFCNGQLLPINQNQALFSLLGTVMEAMGKQTSRFPTCEAGRQFILGTATLWARPVGHQLSL